MIGERGLLARVLLAGVLAGELVEDGDNESVVGLRLEPPGDLQTAIVGAEPTVDLVLEGLRLFRCIRREDLGSFHFFSPRVFFLAT